MNFLDARVGDGAVAVVGDAEVEVPASAQRGEVTLGVRPEAVTVVGADASATGLRGEVGARELLGAEAVLHVRTAAGEVRARVAAGHPARVGDAVRLQLAPDAIHVFAREPAP
jgi:multiple sugar transport system ATP-binding protein